MKNLLILLVFYGAVPSGCQKDSYGTIMRVNYYTVSCTGEMTGKCLLVQKGDNLDTHKWEYFYYHNSIKGFNYEEGYIYTLEVKEEKIKNPLIDGSSINYTLNKIISKQKASISACISEVIKDIESEHVSNPPRSVWQYTYHGKIVYYIPAICCDIPSRLLDNECKLICNPDGGFTGAGDGKCTDFLTARTDEKLIWQDKRK